ncbi:hypothetical protein Gohar_023850 [Gossypium harknessii]|uniref:Uncharacterized protein n=1 Tax=Gossypium harknessii TaxID=34285 RepID=A0A7J9HE30_9ROSI|nr:hypothetical protein [Gossypium harknessii]
MLCLLNEMLSLLARMDCLITCTIMKLLQWWFMH